MTDPVIEDFFQKRKEEWLKKELNDSMNIEEKKDLMEKCLEKFSINTWLPDASKRAGQIKFASHPCTFSHPSARKNKNGYVTSFTSEKINSPDGFLRTGSIQTEKDALGNAAALDVYKFLTLSLKDDKTIIEHIAADTSIARELLDIPTETYANLKAGFISILEDDNTETITSSKIKQVYFPINSENYHLLSILTNSGIVFEMRKRIDMLRFSEEQKTLRDIKKKKEYSDQVFLEIYDITTIGYGGTKPQNISVLNNQYGGKAPLLLSIPPHLEKRDIRFPTKDFFQNSIRYYHIKEPLQKLHGIFKTGLESEIPRKNLKSGRDHRIEEILDQIIIRMTALRSVSTEQFFEKTSRLKEYQKIWLLDENKKTREEQEDWLNTLCIDIAYWILDAYKKVIKKPEPLGQAELNYIKKLIESNKEAFR